MNDVDWPFTPEVEGGGWQVEAGDGIESWMTGYFIEGDDGEHTTTNVNLIAAAPRMYRALKKIAATRGLFHNTTREAQEIVDWIDQR
jgi:hypothetical protein